jgi:hypothetical protein
MLDARESAGTCFVAAPVTIDEVVSAALSWGRSVGWRAGENADGTVVFSLSPLGCWFARCGLDLLRLRVTTSAGSGGVSVECVASRRGIMRGWNCDLRSVACHFARGLCFELGEDRAHNDDPSIDMVGGRRPKELAKDSRRHLVLAQRALLVLAVPCLAVARSMDRELHLVSAMIWLGLLVVLLFWTLQLKLVGVRVRLEVSVLLLMIGLVVGTFVYAALGVAGVAK